MAFNTGVPFDINAEQGGLDRKRALMEALLGKSLQPAQGQMVSGHYIAPGGGGLGALAQALTGPLAALGLKGLDKQQGEITGRYNEGLSKGLQDYFAIQQGSPGEVLTAGQAGDILTKDQAPPVLKDGNPGDPRRAAVGALTSQYKPLQDLGRMDLAELSKTRLAELRAAGKGGGTTLTQEDILKLGDFDPKSRLAAALSGDISVLGPKQSEHVVNGQLVAGNPTAGYRTALDARDRFGPVGSVGQYNLATNEVKFRPTGGTTVNVDLGQKAGVKFAEKIGEKRADRIDKSFEAAQSAAKALEALNSAQADFSAGIKSGIAANVGLGLAKFGKALGMDADPAIANTEAFRANMARETLNLVKGLGSGTGISNADREFAEKASGGSITLDDGAMVRLMNVAKAAAANTIMEHKRILGAQAGASGTLPEDLESFRVPLNVQGGEGFNFDPSLQKFTTSGPAGKAASPHGTGTPRRVRFEDLK